MKIHNKNFVPYLRSEQIQSRLDELCARLDAQFADNERPPLFLAVLNGSFMLAADVMRRMRVPAEICFIKLKSYVGMQSSQTLTTAIGLTTELRGRDVILLEDIVDTGNTLARFLPTLHANEPKTLTVFTLLLKPDALQHPDLQLDYVGFEVEDKFLVGYGLDFDELGRQYMDIYQAQED